jgi:hypothetical protein
MYNTIVIAHISITAVKYGMCSEKHNQIDSKNSKIAARIIMNMSNDRDHSVALKQIFATKNRK